MGGATHDLGRGIVGAYSGSRTLTDRDRSMEYLVHLKTQFSGTRVVGLVDEVMGLLANSPYATRIERDIIGMQGEAVSFRYVNSHLYPTLRARLPLSPWGLPKYQKYAELKLDEIVRGHKPEEKKA